MEITLHLGDISEGEQAAERDARARKDRRFPLAGLRDGLIVRQVDIEAWD